MTTVPKFRRLLRRRQRAADGTMPLREHLVELRGRIFKVLLILAVGGVAGWFLYPLIIDVLKEPYCSIPQDQRFPPDSAYGECRLIYTGPLDGFVLRLKIAGIAGALLTAPLWLYQLWAFITPGLRRNEKRWAVTFITVSTLLFAAGAALSYVTVGKALSLLVSIAGPSTVAAISINSYLSFVITMLLVFGVSFELPLLVVVLNLVGILSAARLIRWQRMAIFLIFVFAAVATPSQDPLSMCLLAVPMCLLFEIAVLLAWVHDRRKARRDAIEGYADLPDDVASPLQETPSPLDDVATPLSELDRVDERPPRR